eukprot:TRINITY_DN48013_c0_g1_i1.p1 TRINITY_DN48013_c0_g1~~TRINITY_DN48013_c0_g1_i1.p1  ORF type:complete len:528 (-),score=112.74 TRINITY_DN48013_c0_g1_i1:117-1625(-)
MAAQYASAASPPPFKRQRRDGHREELLPQVTRRALQDEKISRQAGDGRVLGVRKQLRPPSPERDVLGHTPAEASQQRSRDPAPLLRCCHRRAPPPPPPVAAAVAESSSSSSSAFEDAVLAAMRRSPHSIQIAEADFPELLQVQAELPRVLADSAPRRPYRERRNSLKTVVHWGQRKLLLSEIEFLTLYGRDCTRVIYAGSAPGTHVPFLETLFPHLHFVLVDPGEFRVKATAKVEVRREFFTTELARALREDPKRPSSSTLFISDVRTGDPKIHSKEQVEAYVAKDMAMQQEWVRALEPHRAMLKFRLPWTPGRTEYLHGDIHLPVWGPPTTTETRLITDGKRTKLYDHRKYEEQMFFFNNVTRVRRYKTDVIGAGLCEGYDSAAEVRILQGFLRSVSREHSEALRTNFEAAAKAAFEDRSRTFTLPDKVDHTLALLFQQLSIQSSTRARAGRHLMTFLPMETRDRWYNAKVFDAETGVYVDASSEAGQELLCAQHSAAAST